MAGMTVSLIEQPGEHEAQFCAALYSDYERREPDGEVNPFHPDYRFGGVHFGRKPEWFMRQFAVPGARLLVCRDGERRVGYGLYFTAVDHFPEFASETLRYRSLPGVDSRLAYTYLFVIQGCFRRRGWGWQLVDEIRRDCANCGCVALAHEFVIRPVVNLSSAVMHGHAVERYGAIDTGRTATHVLTLRGREVPIVYAHCLIPTNDNQRFAISPTGDIALVQRW